MINTKFIPPLVILGLLLWLSFLFYKSQSVDTALHTRTVSTIQQLKQHDALMNQDILEVRFQSQLNMDLLVQHVEQAFQLISELKQTLNDQGVKIEQELIVLEDLFAQKKGWIEQFKSHNGILRNSLRYLPSAVEKAMPVLSDLQAEQIDHLLKMILTYNLSPDQVLKQKILEYMPKLKSDQRDVRHVLAHSHVVIREHAVVSRLMNELLELHSPQAIASVYKVYDDDYQKLVRDADTYRIFLFFFSIVLFIYIIYLFRTQSRTATLLRETVRDLEFQKYAMDQHAIVAITDTRGIITYANPKFQEISQYSYDELMGSNQSIVNSGRHSKGFFKQVWATIGRGKVWHGDIQNRKKNGDFYWVDTTIVPFVGEDGKPFQYVSIRTDITKQMLTREELKKEHELLERIMDSIPSILIGVDARGEINLWNQAAENVFAMQTEMVLGKPLYECPIEWDIELLDQAVVISRNTGFAKLDHFKFRRNDDSDGFLGITINAIFEAGNDAGFLLLASDITEKTQMESQLQLSQKMEAIGELAAGIAHEVNTPLQYVGDNIRFLRDSITDLHGLCKHYHQLKHRCEQENFAPELLRELEKVDEEADIEYLFEEMPVAVEQSLDGVVKAGAIVSAMKEFSHPGTKDKSLTDLNRAIANTVTVSRNEWKYVAEVKTLFDEQLPLAPCLPEINQVILNMIVNAAHAITDKLGEDTSELGLITIQTSHTERYAQIDISDSGAGITEENQKKVFVPFYTTKEVGKGTGQGLAISHNIIVERHQGTIQLVSELGEGTTFTIRLPVSEQQGGGDS